MGLALGGPRPLTAAEVHANFVLLDALMSVVFDISSDQDPFPSANCGVRLSRPCSEHSSWKPTVA